MEREARGTGLRVSAFWSPLPMGSSNTGAVSIAPIFLRLALGFTFLWAGLGKVMSKEGVAGDDAAWLARQGVEVTPSVSTPKEGAKDGEKRIVIESEFNAAQFPEPVPLRKVYTLAVRLHQAGKSTNTEAGAKGMALWPKALAEGSAPIYAAWAAALTETLAGSFLVVGLLTRLSAFSLAMVMTTAMWLTQVGPAIQSGNARFGFLPAHETFDTAAWSALWWQVALLAGAWALVFAGSGAVAFDRVLFGRKPAEPAPKPKPAGAARPV